MARTFSLQPVLSYRERIAEALEMELGRLLATAQEIKAVITALQRDEQESFDELARRQTGMLDLMAIEQLRGHLQNVQKQIEAQKARLAEMQNQIEAKRQEVTTAQQDKETLEKLKEREENAWQAEVLRRETAERDDIYIAQAYRRSQE